MKIVDYFLDRITMYRLMLYFLIVAVLTASVLGFLGILPYSFSSIIFSATFLTVVCFIANKIFSFIFKAPANIESSYITALILSLILTPIQSFSDFYVLTIVGIIAMASKYILAVSRKHIFNPAAFAVVISALTINKSASWWVGNEYMLPIIFIGGVLILRKIQKKDLFLSFLLVSFAMISISSLLRNLDFMEIFKTFYLFSPFFFFAFVMLVEPLTSPPSRKLQMFYGALVGFLFAPQVHIGSFYITPELALLIGNIFSFIVSPKYKLMLILKDKIQYGVDILDFNFFLGKKFLFLPGQYMEWTLPHKNPDSRGNRRYFTIASSPTEDILKLGVKFYQNGSSFKNKMANLDANTPIVGAALAGEFTLPEDKNQKCVFIAGGIGITPYRSMLKYLIDTKETRPIILFYSNKKESEIAYKDVFERAEKELGIKTVYVLTEEEGISANWTGKRGRISPQIIQEEVPDYMERTFYLSGPHSMIMAFNETLRSIGIRKKQIKEDFFPGYS